jgi:hypothetical protein
MKGAMNNSEFLYLCNKISEYNNFKYDNIEPSLMTGWLPRVLNNRNLRVSNQEGVTTSSVSVLNNNQNQESPTSLKDEDIV